MNDQDTSSKLVFSFMRPVYEGLADFAYPLLRVTAGLMFVTHGYMKLFGGWFDGTVKFFTKLGLEPAEVLVTYVGIVEFFGGILIAIGLLTRPLALLTAINLFVLVFYVHWGPGFFWNKGGYEFVLLWGMVMVAIFIRGGHRHSVDSRMSWEF